MLKKIRNNLPPILWVLDIETSGLDPVEDSIISAGKIEIHNNAIQLKTAQQWYFKPTALNGQDVFASAVLHGITNDEIEGMGIELEFWLRDLVQRTEEAKVAWVFHHALFDLSFLKTQCERHSIPWPKVNVIDTMVIERELFASDHLESQEQLSIYACRERHGLPAATSHKALSDAIATAELLLAQSQ